MVQCALRNNTLHDLLQQLEGLLRAVLPEELPLVDPHDEDGMLPLRVAGARLDVEHRAREAPPRLPFQWSNSAASAHGSRPSAAAGAADGSLSFCRDSGTLDKLFF